MAANDDPFDNFQFIPPPEAPVFEPTEEEFADPLAYIAKIRPIAVKTGICKIRPPKDWKPPFAVDIDKFRFTPRVQRLYELEAQSRIKLNFICNLAQFNRLQGKEKFRVPNLFGRHLDLYKLHKLVSNYGGYEIVTNQRKWNLIAEKMSYPQPNKAGLALKGNYERVLLPYVLTMGGFNHDPQVVKQLFPIKPLKCRESMDGVICQTAKKRKRDSLDGSNQVSTLSDYDSNRELKKLQFFGPGPKAAVPTTSGDEGPKLESSTSVSIPVPNPPSSEERKPVRRTPPQHGIKRPIVNEIDNIVCSACCRGDDEDVLLICGTKACDKSYHTYCLVPPLSSLPKEEWCCPVCVQKTCSQPPEEFGFPQSQTTYSLAEFGHKADLFKSAYFQRECYQVPYREVEREFWRVLQAFNEDVVVEYGADIHSSKTGSGFPVQSTVDCCVKKLGNRELAEKHVCSPWNLNRLPVLDKSVLRYVKGDISGMKVPWCYVGMVFSSFCWHIEDHWSYSINYLHWGEPKTWYGVSGLEADKFEAAMRKQAPELFTQSPDLLHHITTNMNPNLLQGEGVHIFRTDQQAGDFIVTFPRAYHAGFNQGFNFAEAVNFCTADWLPMGRGCIEHYSELGRPCVFSHDELLFTIAEDYLANTKRQEGKNSIDMCTLRILIEELNITLDVEIRLRQALLDKGIRVTNHVILFEDYVDDERMCEVCAITCYLSAVTCDCLASAASKINKGSTAVLDSSPIGKMGSKLPNSTGSDGATCLPNSKMMGKIAPKKGHSQLYCLKHALEADCCFISKKTMLYRYTIDEMRKTIAALAVQLQGLEAWEAKAASLSSLSETKAFLDEGRLAGFHQSSVYRLKDALCYMATTFQFLFPLVLSILSGETSPSTIRGPKRYIKLFLIDRDPCIKEVTLTEYIVDLKCLKEEDISRIVKLSEEISFPEVCQSFREDRMEMMRRMSRLSTWRIELKQVLCSPLPSAYSKLVELCQEAGRTFNIVLQEFEYLDLFGKGLNWLHRVTECLPSLPVPRENTLVKVPTTPPVQMWPSLALVMAIYKEAPHLFSLRQQLEKKKPPHAALLAPLFTRMNDIVLPLRALATAAETINREVELCLIKQDTPEWQPPQMSVLSRLVQSSNELCIRLDLLNNLRVKCWSHWWNAYISPLNLSKHLLQLSDPSSDLKDASIPTIKPLSYTIGKDIFDVGVNMLKENILHEDGAHQRLQELQQCIISFDGLLRKLKSLYQKEDADDNQLLRAILPRQVNETWDSDSACSQFSKTFQTLMDSCHGFATEQFTHTMANTYRRLIEEEQSSLLVITKQSSLCPSNSIIHLLTNPVCFICLKENNLSDTPLKTDIFQLRLCHLCYTTCRPSFSTLIQLDARFEKEPLIAELSLALRALTRRVIQWLENVESLVLSHREIVQPILYRLQKRGQCQVPPVLLEGYTPDSDENFEDSPIVPASAEESAVLRPHIITLLRVGLCFEVGIWSQLNFLMKLMLYLECNEDGDVSQKQSMETASSSLNLGKCGSSS